MTPRSPKSPTPRATKRKALPPIYVVVGEDDFIWTSSCTDTEARAEEMLVFRTAGKRTLQKGDRIVKYLPVPPRASKSKGARRGK